MGEGKDDFRGASVYADSASGGTNALCPSSLSAFADGGSCRARSSLFVVVGSSSRITCWMGLEICRGDDERIV